jgi:hypothetical protein
MGWMPPRVLSNDPETGIQELFYYDPDTDQMAIEVVQDVTPILEVSKALFAQTDARAGWKGDLHRVAQIPLVLFYELKKKGLTIDRKAMKRWLNDRDNEAFRTRPGRV